MAQKRISRISNEYLRALSDTMKTLKDPRISGLVSITRCEVTGDLRYVKIYVSVLGSEQQKKDALEGLKNASGFIRSDVVSRISLRAAPEPIFELDDSIKRGSAVLSILSEIKEEPKRFNITIKADFPDCLKLFEEEDNFLILTHARPDGDTLGSAAALCYALTKLDKTAYVLENPDITKKYAFLIEDIAAPEGYEPETVIAVDIADGSLFPENARDYIGYVDLAIDHHRDIPDYARLALSQPERAACGEIVYDLIKFMGISLDKKMAEAIYTAVSTDTGCFRYSNVTSSTFRTAADCLDAGINAAALNRIYFELKSRSRMMLDGIVESTMKFFEDGKIALVIIDEETITSLGITNDDLDGISGFPRRIEGVEIGITVTQRPDGNKVSVRTSPDADASAICRRFDGGGHRCAAGCTLSGSLEETGERLVTAAIEELSKIK